MSQVLQESNVAEPHAASQTAKQATKQATAQPQERPSAREHRASSSAPRVSLAPAADRTLDILEFIAGNGQTQAATLARELGIPRSTVYQLLEILERHGFTNYKLFRRMFLEQFGDTPTKIRKQRESL